MSQQVGCVRDKALLAVSTFPQCLPCLHLGIETVEHPALVYFKTLLQEVLVIAARSEHFFTQTVVGVDLVHFLTVWS